MALCYLSYLHDSMLFLSLHDREAMFLHGRRRPKAVNLGETLKFKAQSPCTVPMFPYYNLKENQDACSKLFCNAI